MEHLNLSIESGTDPNSFAANVGKAFELLSGAPYLISVELNCPSLSASDYKFFLKWLKDFYSEYTVSNTKSIIITEIGSAPKQITRSSARMLKDIGASVKLKFNSASSEIKGAMDILNKVKIRVYAEFRQEDPKSVYEPYRYSGLEIRLVESKVVFEELKASFDEWCYDKRGVRIDLFSNIISVSKNQGSAVDCIHGSCLGKNLFISEDGTVSFCKIFASDTVLGTLDKFSRIEDVFDNPKFIRILRTGIAKRNICKSNCAHYDICEGGCPLRNDTTCREGDYIKLYDYISNKIKDIILHEDYSLLNPSLRHQILSIISSGNGGFIASEKA